MFKFSALIATCALANAFRNPDPVDEAAVSKSTLILT